MNTLVATIGNLAGSDLLLIFAVVLLMFGAKKLPELAKGMGQAVKEFNKAKDEFEREITKPAVEMTVQQPKEVQPQTPVVVIAAAPAPSQSSTLPS